MTRCRAKNWSQYNRSLIQQGSIIFWIQRAAAKSWFSNEGSSGGRPKIYSDCAVLALLIVKAVFGCGYRQLQGLMTDFLHLLGTDAKCPDYSTICRRGQKIRVPIKAYRKGPIHVIVDSTGLKIYGEGEWRMRRESLSFHRGWKKIHVGLCATTQQIVAFSLTNKEVADSLELPPLLKQVQGEVETVICDGAYDCIGCYEAVHERRARALIPPRKGARQSSGEPALEPRNRAIIRIRDQRRGRKRWKKEVGYHRRSLVETTMHRLKALNKGRLKARLTSAQLAEISTQIFVLNETMALRT